MRKFLISLICVFSSLSIKAMYLENYVNNNSYLEEKSHKFDRTYYYSNQNYRNVGSEIKKLLKIKEPETSLAVFIGEGNVFQLLPILREHVSNVVILDVDDKLISYKRAELEAFKKSKNSEEFYCSMIDYMSYFYPVYKNLPKETAIEVIKFTFGLPTINDKQFKEIKNAITNMKLYFIQHDIKDKSKTIQLGEAIQQSGMVITIVNRTNLMEYMTPHMQIKFFEKQIPELLDLLSNFQFLPIHKNVITLFGVSHQKNEETYVMQGWNESIQKEASLIEENRKYHQ